MRASLIGSDHSVYLLFDVSPSLVLAHPATRRARNASARLKVYRRKRQNPVSNPAAEIQLYQRLPM